MNIIGYGEDVLTYWALKDRIKDILKPFQDTTPLDELVILYRPRFGKQAKKLKAKTPSEAGPGFGEFDAIISTPDTVYLLEAKWTKSREAVEGQVSLDSKQIRRHQIMSAYLNKWADACKGMELDWNGFYEMNRDVDGVFLLAPPLRRLNENSESNSIPANDALRVTLPKLKDKKGRVARNLGYVLDQIGRTRKEIRNVLLFISMKPINQDVTEVSNLFTVVPLYCNCAISGFVTFP